jgi:hypothetical protein
MDTSLQSACENLKIDVTQHEIAYKVAISQKFKGLQIKSYGDILAITSLNNFFDYLGLENFIIPAYSGLPEIEAIDRGRFTCLWFEPKKSQLYIPLDESVSDKPYLGCIVLTFDMPNLKLYQSSLANLIGFTQRQGEIISLDALKPIDDLFELF